MSELLALQRAFTEHLRNPDHVPVPEGLDKRRMGTYSELIFNNVSSLLSDFFPVIRSILPEQTWQTMVRDFFISHQSQTPYFMELSGEFVQYLSQRQLSADLPAFLLELAHYEWIELAVFTLDETLPDEAIDESELASSRLSLTELAEPLVYQYPVHRISKDFVPSSPGNEPSYLLVGRQPDESVKFFELQPLAFHLLHDMQQAGSLVPETWLAEKADELQVTDKSLFVRNGIGLLTSFNQLRMFYKG